MNVHIGRLVPKYAGEALTESLDDLRADLASVPPAFGAWLGTRLAGSVPRPSGRRPHGGGPPAVRTLWLVTGATSDGSPTRYRRAGHSVVGAATDSAGVAIAVLEKAVPRADP